MDIRQIHRIRQAFPCFGDVASDGWKAAEIIAVTPETPHTIREGHRLRHAMFILNGSIRIYKISPEGREITLYRVGSSECCVLMMASILGETEYEASAAVETDTEVLLVPATDFRNWMDAYLPVRQFIYKQFVARMTNVTLLLEKIAFQSIPCRLAEYLLTEAARRESDSLRMTHEQLAVELGTAREVVSRTLKDFAVKGALAAKRGRIDLLDKTLLRGFTGKER
ncbi:MULTISPECIES: Crp/Fnr family transcriptional regulator [unclassified Paenibacillus]|uniref:Crp/Fnr family transcriptional regulator n=1 Tax=unclassified Paenibacillus TaxID=185978 RepID=UPI001C0F94DE|nr:MULTISPECIES: Crp/Fnr family transcriptional regulator [unclassified Paenibacillus]MBU5444851.1 Crp/Fnr family transcriptional regulator [Paenibacillus sp. MSJ-34]CAH0121913.1 hypothetical protein PAE9249_04448 [Paenibacillus sp. CECT 9249]